MTRPQLFADSSAIIANLRRDERVRRYFKEFDVITNRIALGELMFGVLKSASRGRAWRQLRGALKRIRLIDITSSTASHYASICYGLEETGSRIPQNDMWIAAAALERQIPLLASDAHFERVPGLQVIRF